jgi:hypothetical protein
MKEGEVMSEGSLHARPDFTSTARADLANINSLDWKESDGFQTSKVPPKALESIKRVFGKNIEQYVDYNEDGEKNLWVSIKNETFTQKLDELGSERSSKANTLSTKNAVEGVTGRSGTRPPADKLAQWKNKARNKKEE